MAEVKLANRDNQETPVKNYSGFRRQQLLLFVLASILIHGLGLLIFSIYQHFHPVAKNKPEDSKPIEFVVVPPEESSKQPPPETQKRAAENSVAEKKVEPKKTSTDREIGDDTAPTPASTPLKQPTPAPQIASPPKPEPEPEPEPVEPPKPEPQAQPEPKPEPKLTKLPKNNQPLLSNPDAVSTSKPDPQSTPEASPQPKPELAKPETKPEPESSVATRLPPKEPSQTVPKSGSEAVTGNSASSLLGGDYKKTLANGGGDAFFSPEALAYKDVLNPSQLNALKDIDLSDYFAEVKRRVKSNWNPSYRAEEYTTYLSFNIEKNGQITELRVTQTSGSEKVDRESLDAVQNSAPFAPLPLEFPLEALEVQFSFNIYIY